MNYPKKWEIHYKDGSVGRYESQKDVVDIIWRGGLNRDGSIDHIECEDYVYSVDEVYNNVILRHIEIPQDIVWAFDVLQEKAKQIGTPITYKSNSSRPLVLYFHEDYDDRILIDKKISDELHLCPKCKCLLGPSDVRDYEFVCKNCDENFYECEVV